MISLAEEIRIELKKLQFGEVPRENPLTRYIPNNRECASIPVAIHDHKTEYLTPKSRECASIPVAIHDSNTKYLKN